MDMRQLFSLGNSLKINMVMIIFGKEYKNKGTNRQKGSCMNKRNVLII
jgi:hypothetical protein